MDVAKFYKIDKKKLFFKVILPQFDFYLLSSARSGPSLIWKIVLVVELLGAEVTGLALNYMVFFNFLILCRILAYTLAFVILIIFVEFIIVRPFEKKNFHLEIKFNDI